MNITQSVELSLREMWGHRFRSLLSMSGIVLGVSSLIATFSLTAGIEKGVRQLMTEVGGLEMVTVVNKEISSRMIEFWNLSPGRTVRDAYAIKRSAPLVSHVSPELTHGVAVSADGGDPLRVRATGVWPDYREIANHELAAGRFISDLDVERAQRCVVVGWEIAARLWPGKDPTQAVGHKVFLNNDPFTIVGVLRLYERDEDKRRREIKEQSAAINKKPPRPAPMSRGRGTSRNWNPLQQKNEAVLLPFTTLFYQFKSGQFPDNTPENVPLDNIRFRIADLGYFQQAIDQAARALDVTHRGVDDFGFDTREEWFGSMEAGLRATRLSGALIAGISLVVGAIGITNIMLASITERVREIGIRRAVGARTRDIFVQILIESVLISFIGGLIGILFSLVLIQILIAISPDRNVPELQPFTIVISVGFALLAGLVSGIYPAWKASNLDPIQALRYE